MKVEKGESSGTDQWPGGVIIDSADDPTDEDLGEFLQSTASFVFNITRTAAFTDACQMLVISLRTFSLFAHQRFVQHMFDPQRAPILQRKHKDMKCLVRKYLPPGNVYELYQFYCSWCDAHSVDACASNLATIQLVLFSIL